MPHRQLRRWNPSSATSQYPPFQPDICRNRARARAGALAPAPGGYRDAPRNPTTQPPRPPAPPAPPAEMSVSQNGGCAHDEAPQAAGLAHGFCFSVRRHPSPPPTPHPPAPAHRTPAPLSVGWAVNPLLATSVRQIRRDQKELGPTESVTRRSRFLLSSACDRSGQCRLADGAGLAPTPVACSTKHGVPALALPPELHRSLTMPL